MGLSTIPFHPSKWTPLIIRESDMHQKIQFHIAFLTANTNGTPRICDVATFIAENECKENPLGKSGMKIGHAEVLTCEEAMARDVIGLLDKILEVKAQQSASRARYFS